VTEQARHVDERSHFGRDLAIWIAGVAFFGAVTFGLLAFFADPTTPVAAGDGSTTSSSTTTTEPDDTTTTEPADTTTTTEVPPTVPVRPPGEVTVLVLNHPGGMVGAAGRLTQRLAQEGYQIRPASDYQQTLDPSRIWYREGFAAEATELVRFVPGAQVEPLPNEALGPPANIIILLGPDYEE